MHIGSRRATSTHKIFMNLILIFDLLDFVKHIINHCANLIKLLTYAGQMLKIFSEKFGIGRVLYLGKERNYYVVNNENS